MASPLRFTKTVAARTRTADLIRSTPDLLALYTKSGGLPADLQGIVESGQNAELLFSARGTTKADGTAATVQVLKTFSDLQKEYVAIMAVLQATLLDLERTNASAETITATKKILANETAVVFRTTEKEGTKKTVAVKSKSQEAQRTEIRKDAAALLATPALLDAMAKRNVPASRLKALLDAADALAGKLAERAAAKGAGKEATQGISNAVRDQRRLWGACYRIFALVGNADERVRSMLTECAS